MKTAFSLRILAVLITLSGCSDVWGESTIPQRISGRDFPSVFQAWNPAQTHDKEPEVQTEARHDLLFHAADFFGLSWNGEHPGVATGFSKDSLGRGIKRREKLLELNPNMVVLCEIRYRDAHRSFLPKTSEWWTRNEKGEPVVGWKEGAYLLLEFSNTAFQEHVAKRAKAAVKSGVFDGVFLDWWEEDDSRISLLKKIREAIGEEALILVNANDRKSPRSARFINGHFMECYQTSEAEDWRRIEETLVWAEASLREPRINCLETWYEKSRMDLRLMRATTTLGLTRSNGYVLFSDPNPKPTPDHLHDWYAFWNARIGKPVAPGVKRTDGSVLRRFEFGYAAYNPPGKTTTVKFSHPHRRFSDGQIAYTHEIAPHDGDIFIGDTAVTGQGSTDQPITDVESKSESKENQTRPQ